MIRVERHPLGKRTYIFRARVHHGLVGLALIAIGTVLLVHDRADFPFTDRRNH